MTDHMTDGEVYMHYCNSTWVLGFVLDCERAEEHNVRLVQTASDHKASVVRLSKTGRA